MKIIEENTGSLIIPINVNYVTAKKQLVGLYPQVKIQKISFSKNKHIQYQIRKLNKLKYISPRPLSKKLEICFSWRKKSRKLNKLNYISPRPLSKKLEILFSQRKKSEHYHHQSNEKMIRNGETLPDLMNFLLQKIKESQSSDMSNESNCDMEKENVSVESALGMKNSEFEKGEENLNKDVSYVCVLDESNPIKINLKREKSNTQNSNLEGSSGEQEMNKKNRYSLYLKKNKEKDNSDNCKKKQNIAGEEDLENFLTHVENWDSSDGTSVTVAEGRSAENTRSESYSTAKNFSESEDTLTRELKERLRKRKKAATDSGEPSEKFARYDNKDSAKEDQARTEISLSSEQHVPSPRDAENLDESTPRFTPYSESLNPKYQSSPLKRNPFSSSVNNADVVVEGDFDDELMKSMEKNWKDRFSDTDIPEEETEGSVPLQEVVQKLLNKPDRLDGKAINLMKKGLCFNFVQNLPCSYSPCKFEHNARTLFRKKLRYVPTSFIVQMIVAMKDDAFFVDVLLEGFDILKSRANSVRFLPFVCFFAFYASDPKDLTFISFWSDAARYFTNSLDSSDIVDGFTHLLKIFRQIDQEMQPKIMDFLRLLKHPSFNFEMNWRLLKPVIPLKVPSEFLIEAVKSCNKSKTNIQEIHDEIISRILVKNLSIEDVEVILQFCEVLRAERELDKAVILKRRLRNRVQTFESALDKNKYPQTYFYFQEIVERSPCEVIENDEEEEERKIEIVLKNDEERLQRRGFSPPPPNCRLNPAFFMSFKTLPRQFENRQRPVQTSLKRRKGRVSERSHEFSCLIVQVVNQIRIFEFSAVGMALNFFHMKDISRAADEIVQTILQMTIEPDEVVNFFQTVSLNCTTRNSNVLISSIAMTMIVFFIRIPDWSTAYTIFKTCSGYEIDLSNGEVFSTTEIEKQILNSRSRKILLLFETCLNNEKLEEAYRLMEKFNLFSSNGSSCDANESLKTNLIIEFIRKIIDCELTELVYNTFINIWQAQRSINNGIDLREYADEFLILLFNDNKVAASNNYKNLLPYNCLKETTMRTIIVELVRLSRVQEAESLMQSHCHTIYKLPIMNGEPMALTLLTYWTKEEFFLVLDLFLDKLTRYFNSNDIKRDAIFRVEIILHEFEKSTLPKEVRITPKSLKEEDSSLLSAKSKLDEVLNDEAFLFLTVYGSGSQLVIDPFTLMKHLEHRSHLCIRKEERN